MVTATAIDQNTKFILSELGVDEGIVSKSSDPARAAALIRSLLYYRFLSPANQAKIDDTIYAMRRDPSGFYQFMVMTMARLREDPEDYPFSLSSDEFERCSKMLGKGQVPAVAPTPPSMLQKILEDDSTLLTLSNAIVLFIPGGVWARVGLSGANILARLGTVNGAITIGKVTYERSSTFDAMKVNRLFPIYQKDALRRQALH